MLDGRGTQSTYDPHNSSMSGGIEAVPKEDWGMMEERMIWRQGEVRVVVFGDGGNCGYLTFYHFHGDWLNWVSLRCHLCEEIRVCKEFFYERMKDK
ncbi:hypothetical protein VNO77_42240 [Canavalia gladiata]|uniref:Uncharacterized protein n=1 Tax=Canavalia gladiata TaxID=3824 RepID=A0AAN9K251_CANGL